MLLYFLSLFYPLYFASFFFKKKNYEGKKKTKNKNQRGVEARKFKIFVGQGVNNEGRCKNQLLPSLKMNNIEYKRDECVKVVIKFSDLSMCCSINIMEKDCPIN